MNWEQVKGNWTQMKGELREKYSALTDDEVEQAKGERDQLVGVISEKYGKAKFEVEKELDEWLSER